MVKLKIKKGDKVRVISGKDKGSEGEVLQVFPKDLRAIVSGVNMAKKHKKPTSVSEGGIFYEELPIHISNLSHIDPQSGQVAKVGYKIDGEKKVRFSKKSGSIIDAKRV
jgi:large subunit ribosomal protein L24